MRESRGGIVFAYLTWHVALGRLELIDENGGQYLSCIRQSVRVDEIAHAPLQEFGDMLINKVTTRLTAVLWRAIFSFLK